MVSQPISADQHVEDLIESHPALVGFLIETGLPCLVCGEAYWGTLRELARSRGWDDERIEAMIAEFNKSL